MNTTLRRDADEIICSSIQAVLPDKAVCRALEDFQPGGGRVLLVAAGKAAWQMAYAAVQTLGRVDGGVVVTKYGHVKGRIPGVNCFMRQVIPYRMPTALQPPKKLWRWYRG